MADETEQRETDQQREQRELSEDRAAFVALADLFEDALFETFTAADERLNHVRRANRQRSKDAWKTFAEALVDHATR